MAGSRALVFVGCLNRPVPYLPPPRGRGIGVLAFDSETGALTPLGETEGADNPTFVLPAPDGQTLYATSEVFGWHEGVVTAWRIDPADGRLIYINMQPTQGSITAQASLHPGGRWLFVANYRMGTDGERPAQAVVVLPVAADGGLGPVACGVVHHGAGARAERQEGPHPHCALPSPDGRHVLVADLGTDRIEVYRFDDATGQLAAADGAALPPGTGPRHLAFTPSGAHVVVTGELANTVTCFAWRDGTLTAPAASTLLPAGFAGESHAADIAVAPDGRFVYVSNRGHDSLAVLSLDPAGRLALVGHRPTGATPRSFTLAPSGRFVLVAAQDGHTISVFRRDPQSGLLDGPLAEAALGSPMSVRLAAAVSPLGRHR